MGKVDDNGHFPKHQTKLKFTRLLWKRAKIQQRKLEKQTDNEIDI